ncbi:MAG: RNA-guided endonuclease InsQ/TnpB family protein [Candidatus Binatia bacterium]
METVRTVVCKLRPTPEQRTELEAALRAFADACNHITDVARQIHSTNKVKVQHACYREVRERFGLAANLAIRAIARVCAALKVKEKAHSIFDPTSIDYDQRIFSFRDWDWTFSLTLLQNRQRIETALGERQKGLLQGRTPTSATLVKRRDGRFFLHVQIKDEAPPKRKTASTLGVDLGRRRVAVDSDGTIYEATEVARLRAHSPKVRRSLQAKGTKGAQRALKRLSGRERRHMRHINHVISRRIVDGATTTARTIALEDLTGIRKRTTSRRTHRYHQHSWAFYQLRQCIDYKAQGVGIPVVFVDPAYTSKTCHGYGAIGHRSALKFSCTRCGVFDADWNAALNIATAGAHVTEPELATDAVSGKAQVL